MFIFKAEMSRIPKRLLNVLLTYIPLFTNFINFIIHIYFFKDMYMFNMFGLIIMEENIGIYRRYIADILCIGRGRHDISWRKIGEEIFP